MSQFYAKGQYSISQLETLTQDEWLKMSLSKRSDIRLALSQSIPYERNRIEKARLMSLRSRLIGYSMGGSK
jgi:hypothetical protein